MENLSEKIDLPIPIVRENEYQINSYVMGYHEYRKIWIPKKNELLLAEMESKNIVDKFAVVVKNDETTTVGHLPKGKTGRFSKTIFYFLQVESNSCRVEISDSKAVNLGDGLGMRVPCTLRFHGQSDFIDILSNELCKHN